MQQTLSTSSSKTKILRILAVLVTLTLIVLGIYVHSRMVRRNDLEEDKSSFFEDKNYDVLFFGTSHVELGIDPFLLYRNYGISSYNIGDGHAKPIPLSYVNLAIATAYKKPKVAVLDCYLAEYNFSYSALTTAHVALDGFPFSKVKVKNIMELYGQHGGKKELIFPYYTYHNRWMEKNLVLCWNDSFRTVIKNDGYTPAYYVEREFEGICKENTKITDQNKYLENDQTDSMFYIEKFVSFCRNNSIQPVLMYMPPSNHHSTQIKESNSVQKLAESLKVPYYNMLYSEDDIIDFDTDMTDVSHLNLSGARKVTDYIGNILRNDFNVPDHRGEAEYAHWEDDYKEYRKYIFGKMRDINEFDTLLMACNFDDISVKLYKNENVVFDYVEQKLIAQLTGNIEIFPPDAEKDASDLRIVVTDDATGEVVTEKSFYMGSALHVK